MAKWKRVKDGDWEGGYSLQRADGTGPVVFYVQKKILKDEPQFHFSVGTSPTQAKLIYRRVAANPEKYLPNGKLRQAQNGGAAVFLDADLIEEFRLYQISKNGPEGEKWARESSHRLIDWMERITSTKDLRTLNYHRDLKPMLASWPTMKAARTKAIKTFFGWLKVEKGLIEHHEDPTVAMRVPQSKAEKTKRRKVQDFEHVKAVFDVLEQPAKDVLHLLSATGWHVSEVRRFVNEGELLELQNHAEFIAVMLVRQLKSDAIARTGLKLPEHFAVAKRLIELRDVPTARAKKPMVFANRGERIEAAWERLLKKIQINTETQCWEYQGKVTTQGYGAIGFGSAGAAIFVHRLALEHKRNAPVAGSITHTCGVRHCCNPDHLKEVVNPKVPLNNDPKKREKKPSEKPVKTGLPDETWLAKLVRRANDKVNETRVAKGLPPMPKITLGKMRHTFVTWAVGKGATIEEVAEFVNHKSKATTEKYYVDLAIPQKSVPVTSLETKAISKAPPPAPVFTQRAPEQFKN